MNEAEKKKLKGLAKQIVTLFSENNITIYQAKIVLKHTEQKLNETIIHQKCNQKS